MDTAAHRYVSEVNLSHVLAGQQVGVTQVGELTNVMNRSSLPLAVNRSGKRTCRPCGCGRYYVRLPASFQIARTDSKLLQSRRERGGADSEQIRGTVVIVQPVWCAFERPEDVGAL